MSFLNLIQVNFGVQLKHLVEYFKFDIRN